MVPVKYCSLLVLPPISTKQHLFHHPSSSAPRSRMDPYYPFTAAQWQELELQALFFKFMMSGHPIPPDLIFSINKPRSFITTHQPHSHSQFQSQHFGIGMGLSCFEMRRKIDPEPTRCRRTDGKKWRCSRQTSGDSKYCERHMHRGKSRPTRKLVESKPLTQSQSQSQAVPGSHSNPTSHSSATTNVKDSNLVPFLGINYNQKSSSQQKQKVLLCSDHDVVNRNEKRQRMMNMYHQFIEESPSPTHENRDSWLSLVI